MEEIVKAFGYDPEKIKTVDDLKTSVNADFIRRSAAADDDEIIKTVVGKRLQAVEKAFISHAKDLGIELTDEDFKDAPYTSDRIKVGMSKVKSFHENSINELKTLAEKKGGDAAKEWQEKYGKADKRAADAEGMVKSLQEQLQEKEKWAKDQIKNYRIGEARNKAFGEVTFKDGLTELERVGFETMFNSKYEIDLDDKDQPIIFEKESKKRIDNKAVVGTFMGIKDVLKMEIDLNKLGKTNVHASSEKQKQADPWKDKPNNGDNGNHFGAKISPTFYEK